MTRCLAMVAATVMAVTGCSLLVDTSALTGGEAAAGDGGTDALEASTVSGDAANDALRDAGADGAVSSCTGTFSLDALDVKSPLNALLVSVPSGGPEVYTFLTRNFAAAKSVCTEFWTKTANGLGGIQFSGLGGTYRVFYSNSGGVEEIYDGHINRYVGGHPFSIGWQRVHVELVFPSGAGLGALTVLVDGQLALKDALGGAGFDLTLDTLEVGVPYNNPATSAMSARFDDVRLGAR